MGTLLPPVTLYDVHGLGGRCCQVSTNGAALLCGCTMGHNPLHVVGLILCPQFVRLGGYKFSKVGVAITSAGHPTLRENTFYYPLFHFIFDFARAA